MSMAKNRATQFGSGQPTITGKPQRTATVCTSRRLNGEYSRLQIGEPIPSEPCLPFSNNVSMLHNFLGGCLSMEGKMGRAQFSLHENRGLSGLWSKCSVWSK